MVKFFAVRDNKVGAYHMPFLQHSEIDAIRMMQKELMRGEGDLFLFSEDYDLYYIGQYDEFKGEVKAEETKLLLTIKSLKEDMQKKQKQSEEK